MLLSTTALRCLQNGRITVYNNLNIFDTIRGIFSNLDGQEIIASYYIGDRKLIFGDFLRQNLLLVISKYFYIKIQKSIRIYFFFNLFL